FSCFSDHPDVPAVIACFQSASTLARDRMIDSLPDHLEEMKQRFAAFEGAAANDAKRIGQLEVVSASLISDLESAAKSVSENSGAVAELRIALDAEYARSKVTKENIDSLSAAAEKNADAITAV